MTQITLFIDDEIESKLDELRELTRVVDSVEVIRRALAVYEYLIKKRNEGYRVVLQDGIHQQSLSLI